MEAFIPEIFLAAVVAGVIGSLVGLGGGILIVPLLTIGFGVDIRVAIGASIVSVIATSSGAAAAFSLSGEASPPARRVVAAALLFTWVRGLIIGEAPKRVRASWKD